MTIRSSFALLIVLGFGLQGGAQEVSGMAVSEDDWGKHVVRSAPRAELEKLARSYHQDWAWEFPDQSWEMSDFVESANRHLNALSPFEWKQLRAELASLLEGHPDAAELAQAWYELGAYFPPSDQAREALEAIRDLLEKSPR